MDHGALSRRFWFSSSLAGVTGSILVLTLVWPNWIEGVFGVATTPIVEATESGIVSGLLAATILLAAAARRDRRRSLAGA